MTGQLAAESWTLGDLHRHLHVQHADNPAVLKDCQHILATYLDLNSTSFILQKHRPVTTEEYAALKPLIQRRLEGEPLAYILGQQAFYDLEFHVTPDVLIPRPETELMVAEVLARTDQGAAFSLLDIGTGSGCIAVTIARHRPQAQVQAWEVSTPALEVACLNADKHGVQVELLHRNALAESSWSGEAQYDFILANPPYVAHSEELCAQVTRYEPELALYAAQEGLAFYTVFARQAAKLLNPGGSFICEVGYQQAERVCELFHNSSWTTQVKEDYSGHQRIVMAQPQRVDSSESSV